MKTKKIDELAKLLAQECEVTIVTIDGDRVVVEGEPDKVKDFKSFWEVMIKGGAM